MAFRDYKFKEARDLMVSSQLLKRGISDEAVLAAMSAVSRETFVPEHLIAEAYEDRALSLGPDQTISQPYVIALMLESLRLTKEDRVLEIGTGSGYQTALLCELCTYVYSVELDPLMAERANRKLLELGYKNAQLHVGNGWEGWPKFAPFSAIIVSAAASSIPRDLIHQLAPSGRLVIPIGEPDGSQELVHIERTDQGLVSQELGSVKFVELKDRDSHH